MTTPSEAPAKPPQERRSTISRVWLALAVVSVALVMSVAALYRCVDAERSAVSREAECIRLGHALARASDDLTDAVRKFVITAEPEHLQEYWYEIDIRRTRESVLVRLSELGAPAEELELLATAKRQSDDLVSTEVRGMRLMLTVMGVPEAAMPPSVRAFKLLAADEQLTAAEKVLLAQSIMFDKAYTDAKRRIMDPVDEFQHRMHARVSRETDAARRRTDIVLALTIGCAVSTLLLVLMVVWRRLLDVKARASKGEAK